MLPDNVIRFFQRGLFLRIYKVIQLGHEIFDLCIRSHPAYPVVFVRYNSQQFSIGTAILSYRYSRMAGPLSQPEHILKRHLRRYIGIAHYEPRPVPLDFFDHPRLRFYRLRSIDKRQAAFLGQGNCKPVVRDRLHDCRNHRDIHRQFRLLPLLKLHQRRLKAYFRWNTFHRRIAWNQKILAECPGWLLIIKCHVNPPFFYRFPQSNSLM